MRALVTGATGKVGNAVARALAARGDAVVALVRDVERARTLVPAGVELVQGDVTDPASVARAAAGVEAAFDCMGLIAQWVRDVSVYDRVNAEGARTVAAAAREAGASRHVHLSSIVVFDVPRGGTATETDLATRPPQDPYARSKLRAAALVRAEARPGFDVVLVHPAAVVGPGPLQLHGFDRGLRDAIRRRIPAIPPGGTAISYVDDVVAGLLAAAERGRPGEGYLVGGGYATLREVLRVAVDEAGRGWVPPTMPAWLATGAARASEALARTTGVPPLVTRDQLDHVLWEVRIDTTKARTELGLEPLPWEEAIRRTVRALVDGGHA